MKAVTTPRYIQTKLQTFLTQFEQLYAEFNVSNSNVDAIESLIDTYSHFVMNSQHEKAYQAWDETEAKQQLTRQLADISAQCVKAVETIRARRLLEGVSGTSAYFDNIEHCILEEFGQCHISEEDTLLLVGSGAYPMTLIQVAEETGATVIGIDIDEEAVQLGRQVIQRLAPGYDIQIYHQTVDAVPHIEEVTHVIFSSTVPVKYQILDQLYDLIPNHVSVSMRYGDGFKSIFNYPSKMIDTTKWRCIEKQHRPDHIFDIAIYEKVGGNHD